MSGLNEEYSIEETPISKEPIKDCEVAEEKIMVKTNTVLKEPIE